MSLSSLIVAFCNQPRLNKIKGMSMRLTKSSTQRRYRANSIIGLMEGVPNVEGHLGTY